MNSFLSTAIAGIFALLSSAIFAENTPAVERPNFLWLIAEDMGTELGCYGTKQVSTPNLDRLAAEGMRLTRCYGGPVCSVSRSSFNTGMWATTIGAHNHRTTNKQPLPEGVRTLSDWLREAGYFTANLKELPSACGFQGTAKNDWNFKYPGKPFDSSEWSSLESHQPFYAQLNFQETHREFHAPALADPAKVELPPYYPDHPVTRKDWAAYLDSVTEFDRKVGLVLKQLQEDGLADRTVVMVFGDNGQAHVRGKQFCYESGLHVPMIIRWPKGIPAPAGYTAGKVDDRLISLIDLAPTLIDLAGGTKPPKMEGRIFMGPNREAAREYVFGSRDRCDETVMCIRSVRDARYRYIRNLTPEVPLMAPNAYKQRQYPVWKLIQQLHVEGKLTPVQEILCQPRMPEEELYDLEKDPFEIHNLAASENEEHREVLKRLRGALEKWMEETHDKGIPSGNLPKQ